jgi:hypothetical protein
VAPGKVANIPPKIGCELVSVELSIALGGGVQTKRPPRVAAIVGRARLKQIALDGRKVAEFLAAKKRAKDGLNAVRRARITDFLRRCIALRDIAFLSEQLTLDIWLSLIFQNNNSRHLT